MPCMQCMISIGYACTGLKRVQIGYKKKGSQLVSKPARQGDPPSQPALKTNRNLEVRVLAKEFIAPKAEDRQYNDFFTLPSIIGRLNLTAGLAELPDWPNMI